MLSYFLFIIKSILKQFIAINFCQLEILSSNIWILEHRSINLSMLLSLRLTCQSRALSWADSTSFFTKSRQTTVNRYHHYHSSRWNFVDMEVWMMLLCMLNNIRFIGLFTSKIYGIQDAMPSTRVIAGSECPEHRLCAGQGGGRKRAAQETTKTCVNLFSSVVKSELSYIQIHRSNGTHATLHPTCFKRYSSTRSILTNFCNNQMVVDYNLPGL